MYFLGARRSVTRVSFICWNHTFHIHRPRNYNYKHLLDEFQAKGLSSQERSSHHWRTKNLQQHQTKELHNKNRNRCQLDCSIEPYRERYVGMFWRVLQCSLECSRNSIGSLMECSTEHSQGCYGEHYREHYGERYGNCMEHWPSTQVMSQGSAIILRGVFPGVIRGGLLGML